MVYDKIHVEFEMEQEMSREARKKSIDYYELKVQLRFNYFDEEGQVNYVSDLGKETANYYDYVTYVGQRVMKKFEGINKIEEVDNKGFDFYFRSSGEISRLIKFFEKNYFCETKQSKKVVGRDSLTMRDIVRYTLLVNVLNLGVGDKVAIKGEEYYIKSFNKKEMILRHCKDGSKKIATYAIVKDYFELVSKGSMFEDKAFSS